MLRLIRRHQKARYDRAGRLIGGCTLTSESDRNCPGKVKCPIHLYGVGPDGRRVRESLNTRNWTAASEMLLKREAGVPAEVKKVTVAEAIESFKQFKNGQGPDTKRKTQLVTDRLQSFLENRSIAYIADVKLADIAAFRASWADKADTTRRRDQEVVKSLFKFCFNSDFMHKNPVIHLDPIRVTRAKTAPFTREQQMAIFQALESFPDEYGRTGTAVAAQTKAFVYVLFETGMAIGDVAKLEKSHVQGHRILTNRKKTGEDVFGSLSPHVLAALNNCPHDSEKYFFWSGEGKIHTRTSKWGNRLRKLFKLAGIEKGTPYMFRHSFARDFLEGGGSMAELAELLGNSPAICEKHYSKWDVRRQARLEQNLATMRANNPITKMLAAMESNGTTSTRQ
jgi:integrase